MAAPALNMIGASRSQNISDISSRKECEKDGANKPVHDEGYNSIVSHHKFMLLIQSHLGQEERGTTMVDNVSMASHAKASQNTMESTSSRTQVTNLAQNSTYADTKNN